MLAYPITLEDDDGTVMVNFPGFPGVDHLRG